MPLTLLQTAESGVILRIGGKTETRQFLETLGFVPGSTVTIVTKRKGNLIVKIRDARIAVSEEMASKILVS